MGCNHGCAKRYLGRAWKEVRDAKRGSQDRETHIAARQPLLLELFFGGGAWAYCIYQNRSAIYPSFCVFWPYASAHSPGEQGRNLVVLSFENIPVVVLRNCPVGVGSPEVGNLVEARSHLLHRNCIRKKGKSAMSNAEIDHILFSIEILCKDRRKGRRQISMALLSP